MTATPYLDGRQGIPRTRDPRQRLNSLPSQILAREVNEQINVRHNSFGKSDREIEIVCECERRSCSKHLRISRERYEVVREFPTRFVMKPDHSVADDERVVEQYDRFVVVEKIGPSARVAIFLDPRKRRTGYRLAV